MSNWYGFDIEEERKALLEEYRIVQITDDILKMIYEKEFRHLYEQFDFVCLHDNSFYFYTAKYLIHTDLEDLTKRMLTTIGSV